MKVLKSSDDMEIDESEEKIMLQKNMGRFVGISAVHDYIYRPDTYADKTLYEWVQMAKRVRIPTKTSKQRHQNGTDIKDELDIMEVDTTDPMNILQVTQESLEQERGSDIEEDELCIKDNDPETDNSDSKDNSYHEEDQDKKDYGKQFLKGHPLQKTHQVQFRRKNQNMVPNFVGGSLPRRDHGDREYYCATMLTLFKPWRSGKDLKADDHSWDETFVAHVFTDRQLQIMNNFNLRYECNDARDDFSTQLKQGDGVVLPLLQNKS